MRIEVLGPVRVVLDDGTPVEISRPARRRLLSILALADGRPVSTDVLIDRLWPAGAPDTARAALQTHVSGLRREVGDEVIVTEGHGYRLGLDDSIVLDAARFAEFVGEARRLCDARSWGEALEIIEEALVFWRGDPYQELGYDDFALAEVTRLGELHLALLELRGECRLALGRAEEALPDLEALVVEFPLRERLWEHLMMARYRLGRHTEALRAYREVAEHLAEAGLEPGRRLRRLEEKILLHDPALSKPQHNLGEELDGFIGREDEVRDVEKLVVDHRLVTVTGPGGVGKTRLARQVARAVLEAFPDGVWFVELAPVRRSDSIVSEIAVAAGVKPGAEDVFADLIRSMADEATLIVLDNCEHLTEDLARVVRRLLESCVGLRVLATSRAPLRVPGESIYTVSGLPVPSPSTDVEHAADYDSVRLFVERSSRVKYASAFSRNDLVTIVDICRRLDGLPLAIELAAARAGGLSLQAMSDRLDDVLRMLSDGSPAGPARHRSIEAAIAWSYELLTDEQRRIFECLGVARGGFDLEMAEALTGTDGVDPRATATGVASLVDVSLVDSYDWAHGRRYRLLDTVRAFARDRLKDRGELAATRRRLVDWALVYARQFLAQLHQGDREIRFALLAENIDNLSSAIEVAQRTADEDAEALVRATVAWHWYDSGLLTRHEAELARSIELMPDRKLADELRAHHGWALWAINRSDEAFIEAERAYRGLRETMATPAKAYAASSYAALHWLLLDRSSADGVAIAEEAVQIAEACQDDLAETRARVNLATALVTAGHEHEGRVAVERALDLVAEVTDPEIALTSYHELITCVMGIRDVRRELPRRILDRMLTAAGSDAQLARYAGDWVAYLYLQTGEWDDASRVLEIDAVSHLEAIDQLGMLIPRATLHWMRGDLDAAARDVRGAEEIGVHPRWYHDFLALKAEIAADRGDLETAREVAAFYAALDVDPSEAAKKLGTLHPLVRAEVEAAQGAPPALRSEHERRAREALALMRRLLREHPALNSGSFMCETHDTHLTFAAAEVSRLDGSDPDLWRRAKDEADYVYYRTYAEWRLGEALLGAGDGEGGRRHLVAALAEAERIGGRLLARRIAATARAHAIPV